MVKDSIQISKNQNNCFSSAGMQLKPEATARYTEVVETPFRWQKNNTSVNGREPSEKNPERGSSLDTSDYLGTKHSKKGKNTLQKRAVAKYVTNEIIFPLIDLNSTLQKSYWHTFYCTRTITQIGNRIKTKYCGHRWCLVCNRIRTAKLIEGYLPVINREFKNPWFVTLTTPNMPGEELKRAINEMASTINKINNLFRHRRNYRIKGIRKLECTYNWKLNNFNPHFHILVEGEQEAEELINEWLRHYPKADRKAQDMRKADQNSLIELFKYSTKITAKSKSNPEALDTIFRAMYRKKIYQPMGIKKIDQVKDDIDKLESQEIKNLQHAVDEWTWEHDIKDWCNKWGEMLTVRIKEDLKNTEKIQENDTIQERTERESGREATRRKEPNNRTSEKVAAVFY